MLEPGVSPLLAQLVAMSIVVAAATLLGRFLRGLIGEGGPLVAGLVVGVILGPSLLGRFAPDLSEQLWDGAVAERIARDDARRDLMVRQLALDTLDPTAEPAPDALALAEAGVTSAEITWHDARRAHRLPQLILVSLLVAALLASAGSDARRRPPVRAGVGSLLGIGAWAAAIPAAFVIGAGSRWLGFDRLEAILAGCAVAIGPLILPPDDRVTADEVESGGAWTIQTAGRVASVLAIAATFVASGLRGGVQSTLVLAPLLALPIGWLVPSQVVRAGVPVFVPALAALTAIQLEIYVHADVWILLLLIIAGADARWAGATLGGLLTGGRTPRSTLRLTIGSMACGSTQLALAALLLHNEMIREPVALGLLVSAAILGLTTRMRRRLAAELAAPVAIRP